MGRILNDALRTIVNAEKRGFASAELKPVSNVIASILQIMKYKRYIKDFQVHDPHRLGRITVQLQGRVTDCRALTYRQDIKAHYIENYTTRMLPTRQWGYVVVTNLQHQMDFWITRRLLGKMLVVKCLGTITEETSFS